MVNFKKLCVLNFKTNKTHETNQQTVCKCVYATLEN